MILDSKVNFYVVTGTTKTNEGKTRPGEPELVLSNIDCNLQFDDGITAFQTYGTEAADNDCFLYLEDKRVNVIRPNNKAKVNGVWYEIKKWIPYSNHTEFLLREWIR